MSSIVRITPCPTINAEIRPPGSKSITNRAVICAALAEGVSHLDGVLDSEDTEVMISAWRQLGLKIEHDPGRQKLEIQGCRGQLPTNQAEIFVGNSGTTIRFLAAALSACHGRFLLDGVPRMRERPIGDLISALRELGGSIASTNAQHPDCPPVRIEAEGLSGGEANIAGNVSSQFLSGLMMASPLATRDVLLRVTGKLVSVPYVRMTEAVMRAFGAEVEDQEGLIRIAANKKYVAQDYAIEPDASAASYFWAAAALTGGRARVLGLNQNSLQGDVRFCEVLAKMGCRVHYEQEAIEVEGGRLRGVDVDMNDISDTVQTLAAVALFADGPTRICGVAHNRVKETDRISDLARELRKAGALVEEFHDGLEITPGLRIEPTEFATYNDHRMAMSLALLGLRTANIAIQNPECTAKTYPNFWQDLKTFSGCGIEWLN